MQQQLFQSKCISEVLAFIAGMEDSPTLAPQFPEIADFDGRSEANVVEKDGEEEEKPPQGVEEEEQQKQLTSSEEKGAGKEAEDEKLLIMKQTKDALLNQRLKSLWQITVEKLPLAMQAIMPTAPTEAFITEHSAEVEQEIQHEKQDIVTEEVVQEQIQMMWAEERCRLPDSIRSHLPVQAPEDYISKHLEITKKQIIEKNEKEKKESLMITKRIQSRWSQERLLVPESVRKIIPVTAPADYIDLHFEAAKNEVQVLRAELPDEVSDIRTHLQQNCATMTTESCIALQIEDGDKQMGQKKRSSETQTFPGQTTPIANPIDMMLAGGFFFFGDVCR